MKLLLTTQIVDQDSPLLGFFIGWIKEFAKYFDEVHIICLQQGQYDLPENVYVYSLGKEEGENKFKYILRFYKHFVHIFFKVKVTHVFFHMGAVYNIMAAPFFLVRKFTGVRFYWWKTHGHINLTGRLALFFVDQVFTAIDESFQVKTKKKTVVGHAIDVDLFDFDVTDKQANRILFIGRFSRSKRLEQVLEIAFVLEKEGIITNLKFIGQVTDKEYYQELRDKVVELGLSERVEFVEGLPQAELVKEYQMAQIFINPSDNDGLDKVILEAMLSGTIPLTANLSFANVLSDYGLYMQKGDIAGYVAAIKKIQSLSSQDYADLARKLRADVVKNHALSTLVERLSFVKTAT